MDPALHIKKRLNGMHELSNPIGANSDRIIKKGYMNFPFHEPPQSMATKHLPEPHDKFCLSKNQKPQLQHFTFCFLAREGNLASKIPCCSEVVHVLQDTIG